MTEFVDTPITYSCSSRRPSTMLSDANGSINSGGMGGIGNLLALATMSEAYLTSGNNIMDDGNGGDAEIGGGPSFTFTEGDIPAMEDDTSSRRPSMTQSTAPPSQYSTFAITHVNEHQINDIPDKEKSGIKPRTDKPLPRRASSLFKKRFKQTTSNKSQQSQKLPESGTFSMKKNQPPFPVILMAILSGSQNWEYITFLSDEQRFIIIDSVSLESKVLPIHFEENVPTYDQFLQLLDLWGFEVVKDPTYPFVKVFKHPMFQKGDWEGCMQIKLPDPSHPKSSDVEKGQPTVSSRNNRNLPDSQMPPIVSADDVTTNTRSVTPPNAFSGAELFRRLAATQPEVIHPNSSFESILSSLQTNNAMNRRVTYDPTPDDSTAFFEKQILRDCLIRNLELQSMNRSSSMPMLHRRASLNDMNMRVVGLMHLNGNICHPMHRRLSLGDTGGMSRAHIDAQRLQMHGDRIMFPSTSTPSDAEVHSATQNIVSAAIDALRPKRRRLTVDQLPPNSGSTAYLDVMTEIFLERSRKVLSSRPVSIIGSRIQPQVETMTINSDQYMP